MASSHPGHTLALVGPDDAALLAAVIELADKNRATLGLMPRGAFPELAAKNGLLTSHSNESLTGYALFSVARGRVRLIHLCVADGHRRTGVARALIRRISELHPDATGIGLRCRRDYTGAMATWPQLGFVPTGERGGRGKDQTLLTDWWLSHHLPDLFSMSESENDVVVAIDHNVFIDLVLDPGRPGAEESRWLTEEWLPERVTLKVTKVSAKEALKNTDERERHRQLHTLNVFPTLEHSPQAADDAAARWRVAVPRVPDKDRADCDHLISAAAGEARIFVTRDDRLIERYADYAYDTFGIRVIRPSELTIHLDELANGTRYLPVELRGTNYQVSEYGTGAERELDAFLSNRAGEHKTRYHRILREVAGQVDAQRWWVRAPSGELVAAWAWRPLPGSCALEVPFFRTLDTPAGATLGRLISFQLRRDARRHKLTSVLVTDPALPATLRHDLKSDGYVPVPAGLAAAVLDVRDRHSAAATLAPSHDLHHLVREAIASASTPDRIATLERTLWPAKFFDTDIPCYLVPIQPRWARTLFALDETLWVDSDLLGLSREHVYYRSPQASPPVPSRIAWYASSNDGKDPISSFVAVSQLVEIDTASPDILYRRYRRLGVYRRADLKGHGPRGLASAMRFVDTERLVRQIPLEKARQLPRGNEIAHLRGPSRIPTELFQAIYDLGTRAPT